MSSLINQQYPLDNRLLAALPKEVYDQLVPSLELVSLPLKQLLYQPNRAIADVYFPLTTVTSLVTLMQDGQSVEVATIGNEGLVGLPVFLGAETISGEAFTQIPGEAMRMSAASAISRPPPTQCPLMAAMTNLGVFSSRSSVSLAWRQK